MTVSLGETIESLFLPELSGLSLDTSKRKKSARRPAMVRSQLVHSMVLEK